jgi:hypothetical protein
VQYSSGLTVRHTTLTWQNVDSDGIHAAWQQAGTGHDVECNTFNDEVTQLNNRSFPVGMSVDIQDFNGPTASADTVQYNTIVGSPQNAIDGGSTGTVIQYNDINQGYYQGPPYTSQLQMYSNDYAIGPGGNTHQGCPYQGTIADNYIHSVAGRGIGCIYEEDLGGINIYNNYVSTTEPAVNGEYGPNGAVAGGTWVGGCEIDGGRGFEAKDSLSINLYDNTFIVSINQCGGGGIVFTGFPCTDVSCPATASSPFNVHDNTIQIVNTSGGSTGPAMQAACYVFDTAQGNYSNYFSPFLRDNCTSDGDYVATDAYNPGSYFSYYSPIWTIGSHPFSVSCGNSDVGCGHMMHWEGVSDVPPNELGFVFQDVSVGNGASINFQGDDTGGTPEARGATVRWTYTPTVLSSATGQVITGALFSATDSGGNIAQCTTNSSGQCSVVLRQEVVSSPAGNKTLTTTNENPSAAQITASGCTILKYNLTVTAATNDVRTLTCP